MRRRYWWALWTALSLAWVGVIAFEPILAFVIGSMLAIVGVCAGLLVLAWDDDKRKEREFRYLQSRADQGETIIVIKKGRAYYVPRSS